VQLRYDDDFIETAVFLCASGRRQGVSPLQIARFHHEREKLYPILDPDERNAAFFKLHLEWFREWQLEKPLTRLLDEFTSLRSSLDVLAFRKARGRNEEGAELYVQSRAGVPPAGPPAAGAAGPPAPDRRNAVVALRVERLARAEHLIPFLRHEFMHLHDMLDPAFGYSPELHLSGQNLAQQRLTRERYRLLWDITIDGRLINTGRETVGRREAHGAAFDRAFGFWPAAKREEAFADLWNGQNPRHEDLLSIAADPREVKSSHQPLPGALCPLCGFPTFQWADRSRVEGRIGEAIRREFAPWSPEQGACERCAEVFEAAVGTTPGSPGSSVKK
jgi:hypothetical protein